MFFAQITDHLKLGNFSNSISSCFEKDKPFEVHGIIYDVVLQTQDYIAKRHNITAARASISGWLATQVEKGMVELTITNGKDFEYFKQNTEQYMFVPVTATKRLGGNNKDLKDTLDSLKNL